MKAYQFDLVRGVAGLDVSEMNCQQSDEQQVKKGFTEVAAIIASLVAMDKDNTLYLACLELTCIGVPPESNTRGDPLFMEILPMKAECLAGEKTVPFPPVLFSSGLSRFTYDETMPATPDNQAEGLILRRIECLQQAVSLIRSSPGCFVNMKMGMSGEKRAYSRGYIKGIGTGVYGRNLVNVVC